MQIHQEAQALIQNFNTEPVDNSSSNDRPTGEILKMVDFYTNSKHLSGSKDGLGRWKPFYNIVNFRVQVAKVATDLDVKDIQITSDNPEHWVKSMLLQKEAYEWMKRTHFAQRLNEQGKTRPQKGGVVVKKSKKNGELYIETVKWKNFYCDQVSFDGTKIEVHYLTPVEILAKGNVWKDVRNAIKIALDKKSEARVSTEQVATQSDRIKVLEVHGQFPKSFLKEAKGLKVNEEDSWVYSNQVYYLLECDPDVILFAEEEKEHPYMYLPWEEMDGRMLGRGVVEESEEAQVWTNDAVINQKNATDLASRVVIKTNAKNLANNILEVDNGKVFELNDGEDMNAVQLTPSALQFLGEQINLWERQANNATSVYESNTGEQAPSNTPYSQTALLNQVASKPFDYRREEHGIFITQMFEKWVLPFLVKKLQKEHILASDFSEDELMVIDEDFANYTGRQYVKDALVEGRATTPEQLMQFQQEQLRNLRRTGAKRYIKIPDGYFDDIEAKVTVAVTSEQRNKAVVLTSLSNILQTVSSSFNPQTGEFGILKDPVLSRIFGQIVELAGAGLSPVSLRSSQPTSGAQVNAQPLANMPQPAV